MKPFDIYNAAHQFHKSIDCRPWLLIERRAEVFACFPISGENYTGVGFEIRIEDPDFKATGLKKNCFILDAAIYELPIKILDTRRGQLENKLLIAFRQYAGL